MTGALIDTMKADVQRRRDGRVTATVKLVGWTDVDLEAFASYLQAASPFDVPFEARVLGHELKRRSAL